MGHTFIVIPVDTANFADAFTGKLNTRYDLEIEIGEEKYTASTTIPGLAKTINRLYFDEYIDKDDSGKVALYGEFYDPPGTRNYTRYFTSTNEGPYFPTASHRYSMTR